MLRSFLVSVAKYLHRKSLQYLQSNNPYSVHTIPESSTAPVFLLHVGGSIQEGGVTHIKSWIPLFERAGMEYLVVARMMDVYQRLRREYPHVSVSLVGGSKDSDKLLYSFPSLTAFFYIANTGNNNQFLRYRGRHIFLGHGDSDKSASVNRLFKAYDETWVAGQAHIDRFANVDFDITGMTFKIIGRPDAADLLAEGADGYRPVSRITYIPTREGYYPDQDYSSLSIADRLLEAAYRTGGLPLIAKLHPATGQMRPEYRDVDHKICDTLRLEDQLRFVDRNSKLTELLEPGAVFVCDISATVSECLALDQPIFVYVPSNRNIRIASSRMNYSDYAYTYSTVEEFTQKLERVLNGDDYLASGRMQAREYFISPKATMSGAFESELRGIAACSSQSPDIVYDCKEPTKSARFFTKGSAGSL